MLTLTLALTLALGSSGCGTILHLGETEPQGVAIYGGARWWMCALPDDDFAIYLALPAFLIDFPLSVAADTLLLPVSIGYACAVGWISLEGVCEDDDEGPEGGENEDYEIKRSPD